MVKTEKQAVFSRTSQTKNQDALILNSSLQPTEKDLQITAIPNDRNRDFLIMMAMNKEETPPKRELR